MENQNADFNNYQLQDLLDNKAFVNWVLQPDEQLDVYWQKNISAYPNLSAHIPVARQVILSLQFKADFMSEAEKHSLWQNIENQTTAKQKAAYIIPMWLRTVAAAVLIGMVVSIAFYSYFNRNISISTAYGQTKTISLPDGSEIILNANSHVKYAANWKKDNLRQVWIDGEGFFKVTHLHKKGEVTPSERFIVHAGMADVEVLGTTFSVNNRRNEVNVELVTGKISFSLPTRKSATVIMYPGELVHYVNNRDTIVKKKANGISHIDWRNGVLHFDNTNITEVFKFIEDVYGYKAILKNPDIAGKKLSGTFNNTNLDGLLKAISLSLNLSIQKDPATQQLIVNH